jgi:hypothetical protein
MAIITVVIRLEEFIVIIAASRDISSKSVSNSRIDAQDSTIIFIKFLVTVTTVIAIEKATSRKKLFSQQHGM